MNGKSAGKSMKLTVIAAIGIVTAAAAIVCLYRFTGVFTPKITEKRVAQKMDIREPKWVEKLIEDTVPSFKKDFPIYSAFSVSGGRYFVTHVYATRAGLEDVRAHYKGVLENPRAAEKNDVAVLGLDGEAAGRKVSIQNFFSEVSNLIQVEMEISGGYADQIWRKVNDAFPERALAAAPEIAAFAGGESTEGYIMWNFDDYADDFYASLPIYSRAYPFNGTREELEQKINALGESFANMAAAGRGMAKISDANWLYQVNALENKTGVKVVLIIQEKA